MYRNADEIERLKKIKADSNQEMKGALKQLKELSESRDSMQQELVALREVRDTAQEIAEAMDVPERDGDELLSLAGRLYKVPEAFERYVTTITRHYVGYVLGLVNSYWPSTRLDALGKGAKADCTDEQFRQYVEETSVVAKQIVESLKKPGSP